jgi:hypothetical protein
MASPSSSAGDTHPWAAQQGSDGSITRRLMRGAEPVCLDCREPIPDGAPKVGVRLEPTSHVVYWRCGDCQYRIEFA